ncbi:hypothetical protein LCM19_10210 [Qipengyuania flava]|nr:hypothetical protein [Qipengyuania flava]
MSAGTGPQDTKAKDLEANPCSLEHRDQLVSRKPQRGSVLLLEDGREGIFHWHGGDFTEALKADPRQGVFVASSDDPLAARGVWKRAVDTGIRLQWFGAKFDVEQSRSIADATDDTDAWEAALAYLGFTGGGALYLPHGASKVTREIVIPYNSIRIIGSGTRKVYPGKFKPGTKCPSTLVPVHDGRAAFRFLAQKNGDGAFFAENFNLSTLEEGKHPECAFGWDVQAAFFYGYTFSRIGIHGFHSAFDSYKGEGEEYAVGAVVIDDCVINRNRWIVRSLNKTQFNGFRFTNNKAGQNGYLPDQGGIAISGHDVAIENNILEATRDPIFVFGAYRDVSVRGNYFEANVGKACVHLRDIIGPYFVGPNNYGGLDYHNVHHKVLLTFCGLGRCIDPYWPYVTHKLGPSLTGGEAASLLKNSVETGEYGFCRMDQPDGMSWAVRPSMLASASAAGRAAEAIVRETNPHTGVAMPVHSFSTSSRTYIERRAVLPGQTGEWVATSWLFKRIPDNGPPTDIYASMRVDGVISNGSRDYVTYGFSKAWRDGEWCLMTLAIRLQAGMSWIQLLFHPHGVKAGQGRATYHLNPTVYTIADVNDIRPYFDHRQACTVPAPPSTGAWLTGDALSNAAPKEGATKFICTQQGTPGTWVHA